MGGSVSLALEKQYKQQDGNPFGIIQSKTFGSPTVSGKISNPLLKNIVKDEIVTVGAASGLAIGASADSAIGFSDGGLLTGMGADIGKKKSSGFGNRITEDTNTSLYRIRYFGDPASIFDFNAKTVMPSFGFRWDNSAHSYKGLLIAGKAHVHDVERNPLTPPPDDSKAEVITE